MATETSSLGDEWQWISNDTAEVLRATVEIAFTADPRKNWSAEELARWIRDVALVSAKKNVWDHAAALGEHLANGLGYVTGEEYMSLMRLKAENRTHSRWTRRADLSLKLAWCITGGPYSCLLYTSPSPRDQRGSRMPSSA